MKKFPSPEKNLATISGSWAVWQVCLLSFLEPVAGGDGFRGGFPA